MLKANEFNIRRQLLAIVATLPVFGWLGTSVIYPSTQKYRVSMPVELREGYEICVRNSVLQAEIAMLATSYSEALLRGKEQLNQYVDGANSRLKPIDTVLPVTVKRLNAEEAALQDPLILLPDKLNMSPLHSLYLIGYSTSPTYSKSTLGKPNNPYIKLRERDREVVAVRSFWGYPSASMLQKQEKIFRTLLERDGIEYQNMYLTTYSPPWAFYFLRRNELVVPMPPSYTVYK